MRLLALTRYGRLGASSRLRLLQFVPGLRAAGVDVTVSPMLDDRYLDAVYAGRSAMVPVLAGCARRVLRMPHAGLYDCVWVEKECLPWLPAWLERTLISRHCKLLVDYDDAWFHRYDLHRSRIVRALLGGKIDAVMRRADLVVAGNAYIAQRAQAAGARRVEIVPTVVDLDRYPMLAPDGQSNEPVIGWIGSPSTAAYLRDVTPALRAVTATHKVHCVAIGAREEQVAGTPFEAVPWTEASEAEKIRGLDIGIMPLPDEPWVRGKCGYKLIQYMACGLPVVASPVGVNSEIVTSGVNGELVTSQDEWAAALERLVADAALRRRMGSAGRQRVEERYSLQTATPRLLWMLRSVAEGR